MRKTPKWSVGFLAASFVIAILMPANLAFADSPDLNGSYKKGDDLEFEWLFYDDSGETKSEYYSYWNDVYYFDKNSNLVLANSVSDNFYAAVTELDEYSMAPLPLGEDLAAQASSYACTAGEGDLKCTIDTYKANGDPYENISEYYFIGAVNKCTSLDLSGDAKNFCEAHSDNRTIMVFVEKEDEALFISSATPLEMGVTADVELRINTDRELEYVELYLDPNCVRVNSIAPYSGWELDAGESGEGRYYFKASTGATGGTIAGFNVTILSTAPDEAKFANATTMSLGQVYTAHITNGGKYYAFTPTEDGDYAFISSRSPGVDPLAFLYQKIDGSYKVINLDDDGYGSGSDDDTNGSLNFKLMHTLYAGTTYYLRVSSYNNEGDMEYDVHVERIGDPTGINAGDDFYYSEDDSTISKVNYVLKTDAYVEDNIEHSSGGDYHGNCSSPYSSRSDYLDDDGYGGRGGGFFGSYYYYGFDTLLDQRSCGWSNWGNVESKSKFRKPNSVQLTITTPTPGDPYIPDSPIIPTNKPTNKPNNPNTSDNTALTLAVLVLSAFAVTYFCYTSTKKYRA